MGFYIKYHISLVSLNSALASNFAYFVIEYNSNK